MFHVEHDFTSIFKFSLLLVQLCAILTRYSEIRFLTCSMCRPDCGDGENTNWREWHQAEAKTWKKKKAGEKSPACEMFHVEHELTLKFNFSK